MVNKELLRRMEEWKFEELPELIPRNLDVRMGRDIVAIVGPRRAGKTYFMYQKMKELGVREMYVDFEDIVYRNYNPKDIIDAYIEVFGREPKYLFLDEVQNLKDWGVWLRTLHNKGKYKIMITGSSSSLFIEKISKELRGRYISKILLPFSFKEYLKMKNLSMDNISEVRILSELRKYLEFGGYPEVIKCNENIEKKEKLRSIYETTLYRDIIERGRVREREIMEFILRYLISNSGNRVSVSKLSRIIESTFYKISKRTVWKYYNLAKSSLAIFDVPIFTHSRKKEMLIPRKIYAVDTGIYSFVSTKKNFGSAMENVVFLELMRRKNFEDISVRYYYNDRYEIDFVILEKGEIRELIQVSYDLDDTNTYKREVDSLVNFAKKCMCENLKIINWDLEEEKTIRGKKIRFIPLWKYLLGDV